jgi:hypothetical protein
MTDAVNELAGYGTKVLNSLTPWRTPTIVYKT